MLRPSPGRVTTYFGPRPKPTPTSPAKHYGWDFGWGMGLLIVAALGGVVKSAAPSGAYGNRVVIDHGDGLETWYCHLDSFTVRVGHQVNAGQQVGVMGATGNVTATHLHFEVRLHGVAQDPANYLTTTAGIAPSPVVVNTAPIPQEDHMRIVAGRSSGRRFALGELTYQELRMDHASHEAHIWESLPGGAAAGEPLVIEDETLALAIGQIEQRRAQFAAALAFHNGTTAHVAEPNVEQITAAVQVALADEFAGIPEAVRAELKAAL